MGRDWDHGLFGCCFSPFHCIVSYLCPCWQFTVNAVEADECGCCCAAISFFIPIIDCWVLCRTRGKVREKYGIDGTCCGDVITSILCPCCVMIQTAHQLDKAVFRWDHLSMGEEIERT